MAFDYATEAEEELELADRYWSRLPEVEAEVQRMQDLDYYQDN